MKMKKMALAALALTVILGATGCEEVKEFSADSIQTLGDRVSDVTDTISENLGLDALPEEITAEPVKPERVYEIAAPKPTMTEEEKAGEKKKREAILAETDSYFGKASTPVPSAAAEKKDRKNKEKNLKDETVTSAPDKDAEEETAVPPTPTEKPKAGQAPVSDDSLLDW